jgi:hypothetical protein
VGISDGYNYQQALKLNPLLIKLNA